MSGNHGGTDGGESPVNRRSLLRKMAVGATGVAGLAASAGSASAHSDCEKVDEWCDGSRRMIEICCDDGHCWDQGIGLC